eukprot:11705284-Alexandrium_andersonii.AAC.1
MTVPLHRIWFSASWRSHAETGLITRPCFATHRPTFASDARAAQVRGAWRPVAWYCFGWPADVVGLHDAQLGQRDGPRCAPSFIH